ncbi:HNH endonuclease [Planctomycetota bacterium]
MAPEDLDARVRQAAFAFLAEQTLLHGEALPRSLLTTGFKFEGHQVRFAGPQGIFKPAVLPEIPLTITTVPIVEGKPRPYEDEADPDGLLRYRYRGTDPQHRDNVGLRLAMKRNVPLIYLYGLVPGQYMPVWPVFVVGDDPTALCFTVSVEDRAVLATDRLDVHTEPGHAARRSYVTQVTLRRMHQQSFRQRVLRAYREQCSICRLRHKELLEAAHILPDSHPRGEPIVPNGLSLCKLHHAAFDRHILGIRPDLKVELRLDILREIDGPMLKYGLQGFQGSRLYVPRAKRLKPDTDFLEERYELFKQAG